MESKSNIVKEIIEILKSFPIIKYYGEDAAYCCEMNLIYTFNSGYLIHKIDQRFKTLGGVDMNNQANKIISKNGLKCENISMSKTELLEILDELKKYHCEKHNLN